MSFGFRCRCSESRASLLSRDRDGGSFASGMFFPDICPTILQRTTEFFVAYFCLIQCYGICRRRPPGVRVFGRLHRVIELPITAGHTQCLPACRPSRLSIIINATAPSRFEATLARFARLAPLVKQLWPAKATRRHESTNLAPSTPTYRQSPLRTSVGVRRHAAHQRRDHNQIHPYGRCPHATLDTPYGHIGGVEDERMISHVSGKCLNI